MATLELTAFDVIEVRARVDTRASATTITDSVIKGDMTLGVATDWAWSETRKNRLDTVGTETDFNAFLAALSTEEMSHFRRAVKNRTAGIVAGSYRKVRRQDAGGIDQQYTDGHTQADLFRDASSAIESLRAAAPSGAYSSGVSYTLFTSVQR